MHWWKNITSCQSYQTSFLVLMLFSSSYHLIMKTGIPCPSQLASLFVSLVSLLGHMILINPALPCGTTSCSFLYLHPPNFVLNIINHSSINTQLISHVNNILISFMITTFPIWVIMLLISN